MNTRTTVVLHLKMDGVIINLSPKLKICFALDMITSQFNAKTTVCLIVGLEISAAGWVA